MIFISILSLSVGDIVLKGQKTHLITVGHVTRMNLSCDMFIFQRLTYLHV